ncbi:STAS/SEC14 domain-containing protein [Engelhardtia mirabilis]|uniref:STAS/SEC14 domain-containing protein n=1 Tax=Engelhardtia mirabilis TaxID=2528011 RepID=UPI003AF3CD2E
MHETLDELCDEGLLAVRVDGAQLIGDYSRFPRTLETLVSHAGDPAAVLLEVTALGTDEPGQPWRSFEFTSQLLETVEACAVVGEERHREFLVRVGEMLLTEAVVRFFPEGRRDAALDWLRA